MGVPLGKTMKSPSWSSTGSSPTMPPQQFPSVTRWYSSTCSTPGMTVGATSRAGSASAAKGALASTEK